MSRVPEKPSSSFVQPATTERKPGVSPQPVDQLSPTDQNGSAFQKLNGGAQPKVSLSNAGYNHELWEQSPFMRTIKRALDGWQVPPAQNDAGPQLSQVLKAGDPRLTETINLPGREAWRKQMQTLIVSAGAKQEKPTAYYLAGPMGVGKIAAANRFFDTGVLPSAVVKADADYLHNLVPEASELLALGEGRAMNIVHEEASTLARESYAQALNEKRDVVHNSMFGTDTQLQRLEAAKQAGFKRTVIAMVSTVEVAKGRAGANGTFLDEAMLADGHKLFAKNFDALVKSADELVLLRNTGTAMELVGQGKAGSFTVLNQKSYDQFRAMAN